MFSTLRITSNCNLRCLYCYSGSSRDKQAKDLSTAKIKSIIDRLLSNKITHITISGGEPFTRHDICEILSYSAKRTKTGIVSNGTLISKIMAKRLSKIELTNLMISLDGPQDIHDILRGKNTYQRAQKGISNCLGSRIPVGISTTLTNINHKHITSIYNYLKENNINRWIIETLKPQGRSKSSNLQLTKEQQQSVKKTLDRLLATEKNIKISVFDCKNCCSAGTKTISVSPDGTVTPCAFMPDALCGNILKDPWGTIIPKVKEFQERGITCFQRC
ncbi:MAG: radical SAM protein [archaeon]